MATTAPNEAVAIKSAKDPPPETSEKIWTRRLVIASFWAIVIALGLPMWWRTTMVYKANLPLQQMTDWAAGKICWPTLPLAVQIEVSRLPQKQKEPILTAMRNAYNGLSEGAIHDVRFTSNDALLERDTSSLPKSLTVEVAATEGWIWSSKDKSPPAAVIKPHSSILAVTYGKAMESEPDFASVLGLFVAENIHRVLAEEHAILSQLTPSAASEAVTNSLPPDVAESVARRVTRVFNYASTYHITFSLFTPGAWPSAWEIEKGLEEVFNPLLAALSPISNFTVETQVQPYSTLAPSLEPVYNNDLKAWTLRREELGGFVNSAEWPLSPSIGKGATIHFILYIPSPSQSPLVIEPNYSNSWLVPQWGGVAVHDPKLTPGASNPELLTASDLQPALLKFSNHLLALLGVPLTPPESFPLRVATLTRLRAVSLFISASSSLASLARVVSGLPSISIPDSVAHNVSATINHLNDACTEFKKGDFHEALENAREADAHAEKAFFEKSMVGQVYFPEEHKVAVYLPLLGPVAVPLLVSAIREIRPLVQRRLRGRPA